VPTGLTTPDPVRLQQALRDFADQGLRACAIEASSIGLEERRLEGTDIAVAIFTNLTQDHLDYHGSMAAYWQSKRRLFAWPGLRSAVVNTDDAHGLELAQDLQRQRSGALDLWTYSMQGTARLQARHIQHGAHGLVFEVCEGAQSVQLRTRLLGSYNVSNLLAVLGAMRSLGVPLVRCSAGVQRLAPGAGPHGVRRGTRRPGGGGGLCPHPGCPGPGAWPLCAHWRSSAVASCGACLVAVATATPPNGP